MAQHYTIFREGTPIRDKRGGPYILSVKERFQWHGRTVAEILPTIPDGEELFEGLFPTDELWSDSYGEFASAILHEED